MENLREMLKDEGLTGLNLPKAVLKEAFAVGIIENEKLWLNMLMGINATSHMYNENTVIKICKNIKEKYVDALEELKDKVIERIEHIE